MWKSSGALRIGVAVACAAVIGGMVFAQHVGRRTGDPEKIDITGLYRCEGANVRGTCVIRKVGESYTLRWAAGPNARSSTHRGVGLREGARLSVSWKSSEHAGIAVYTIAAGPGLAGKLAAFAGDGEIRMETLSFEKSLAEVTPPREWKIGETALVNWSGDEYWYTATIAKIEGGRYFICFDDEGWFWYGPERLREDDIKAGDRVFAKLTKRPNYRPAAVTERKDRLIKLRFDNGNEVTTTIHFIKVLR